MSTLLMPAALYDRDEARQLLDTELSDSAYQRPFTGPLREALNDLITWLEQSAFSIGSFEVPYGPLLVLAVVIAAVVITVLVVRPRLQRGSTAEEAVEIDPQISAEQLRIRAARHAESRDFGAATQDVFRAMVRGAEERGALPAQRGRTATEITHALGSSFASRARELHQAAETFNRSAYGSDRLTESDYQSVSRLELQLWRTAPDSGYAMSSVRAAVPR